MIYLWTFKDESSSDESVIDKMPAKKTKRCAASSIKNFDGNEVSIFVTDLND